MDMGWILQNIKLPKSLYSDKSWNRNNQFSGKHFSGYWKMMMKDPISSPMVAVAYEKSRIYQG